MCGADTVKILRVLKTVRRPSRGDAPGMSFATWQWIRNWYCAAGWPYETFRDWWEADHIVARADGGGCELANLRTLCVPCHKARTTRQRARKARGVLL